MPRNIIDPKVASGAALEAHEEEAPPQLVKRTFRFVKTQCPAEKIKLSDGTVVEFRIPRTQHNGFAPVGVFETDDGNVVDQLIALSRSGTYHIFLE